jgi:hypothetical protein
MPMIKPLFAARDTVAEANAALGATLLPGFTLVASPLGHPFWHETGMQRFADLNSFLEHFGLIGGFALIETGRITKPASATMEIA